MNAETKDVAVIDPPAEATTILTVIERAAQNPNVDLDKMERLLAMHERIVERQAKAAYFAALSRMQPELPTIAERGGITNKYGEVQSKYALWEDVVEAITPVLSAHGFALSFRTGNFDGGVTVTGVLSHQEGHSEQTAMNLPIDGSGSKNAVQAFGSSVSYGKRYTAAALLNLRTGEIDDDGTATGKPLPREGDGSGRQDTSDITYEMVEPYLNRCADLKAADLTDEDLDSRIYDMHNELRVNKELYEVIGDALAQKKIITKANWKAAIARHRALMSAPLA